MGKGNMESNNTNQNEMTISSAHKGITLIDFWTPWCIPCKTQAVILNELSQRLKGIVKIVRVNIDESENDLIRTKIHAVPTLCLLKDGKEIKRFIGVQPLEILMDTIARYVD
jgi:thioredoxin 1